MTNPASIPQQIFTAYPGAPRPAAPRRFCSNCGSPLPEVAPVDRTACTACGRVDYHNPLPGVVVMVVENDQVLLGRRGPQSFQPGKWCLPGGFIEFEEDFLTAARREVKEETGLEIRTGAILSVISNYLAPGLHTLVITVLADRVAGDLHPGDDIVALQWFPLSGPLPDMAFDADTHIIARYAATGLAGAPVDPRFA